MRLAFALTIPGLVVVLAVLVVLGAVDLEGGSAILRPASPGQSRG